MLKEAEAFPIFKGKLKSGRTNEIPKQRTKSIDIKRAGGLNFWNRGLVAFISYVDIQRSQSAIKSCL